MSLTSGNVHGAVVVGTSFGFITHVRALREAGIHVAAIVGRDPVKTRDRAKRASIPHALTSVEEALALPDVNLVTIATPPHTHAEIAIKACEAGKHVMCEKPFAASVEEAEQMLDAAERAGVVHTLGAEFRFQAGQALATQAVLEGMIGEPKLASFVLLLPTLADASAEVPAWWGVADEGGGWLGAHASHLIDQMRAMLGEWSKVSASLSIVSGHEWTADDTYTIQFETERGCAGVLHSSAATFGPPSALARVAGSSGTVDIVGDSVTLTDSRGSRLLEMPFHLANAAPKPPPDQNLLTTAYDSFHSMGIDIDPFAKLFRTMVDQIEGRVTQGPAAATFADGVALQRITDAIRRSDRSSRWESL